jgi:hypothetical protein
MADSRSFSLDMAPADGSRVSGRLLDEHGAEHRFSSWLGLLSLLEAERVRGPATPREPERNVADREET